MNLTSKFSLKSKLIAGALAVCMLGVGTYTYFNRWIVKSSAPVRVEILE